MQRVFPWLAGGLLLLLGCNSDVAYVKVRGTVSLDGVPIEKGLVRFEAADGKNPSSKGGEIDKGEFTAEVPAGEVIVRITAPKAAAKQEPKASEGPRNPAGGLQETVPTKYNVQSTLKETIKAGHPALEYKLTK